MYALTLDSIRLLKSAVILLLFVLLITGCGTKTEDQDENGATADTSSQAGTEGYKDWPYQTFGTIKFFYPSGHPGQDSFGRFAGKVKGIVEQVSALLQMPVPTDTMYIVYHTGYGQGRELTAHEYPYSSGDTVYFWVPSFVGPPVMEWLLPKWESRPTRHQFLRHGLISLLDFSGQNYHQSTLDMVKNGKFIPLAELAVDTNINYLEERYQSAEAASFVDFLLVAGNIHIFRTLYDSQHPFEKAVDRIWHVPVDTLQAAWLKVAELGATTDTLLK